MLTLPTANPSAVALLLFLVSLTLASIALAAAGLFARWLSHRRSLPLQHGILVVCVLVALASPSLIGFIQWTGCAVIDVAVELPGISPLKNGIAITAQNLPTAPHSSRPPSAVTPQQNGNLASPLAGQADHAADSSTPNRAAKSPTNERPIPEHKMLGAQARAAASSDAIAWLAYAISGVWLLGTCCCLFRLLIGLREVRRLVNSARPVADKRILELATAASAAIGLNKLPPIGHSPLVEVAVSTGVRRARIILPTSQLAEWSDRHWLALLAHEMAHIRRKDVLLGILQRLAIAGYWWNPLIRRVSSTISLLREQICDELAVKHAGPSESYAELIVAMAGRMLDCRTAGPVMAAVNDSAGDLKKRVVRLLDLRRNRASAMDGRTKSAAVAIGLAMVASLMLTSVRLSCARDPATAIDRKPGPETTTISGRVVDHAGNAVAGAEVILLGEERIIVDAGRRDWFVIEGGGRSKPPSTRTNEKGEFSITRTAVGLNRLGVIAADPLFWVVSRKELGQSQGVEIKLPASGSLAVDCDLPGKRAKQPIEIELRTFDGVDWNADMLRFHFGEFSIKNPGETIFEHLPPASYSVERAQMTPTGPQVELMTLADRRLVKVEPDRRATVKINRKVGRPLSGQVVGLEHADLRYAHVMITYFGPEEGQGKDGKRTRVGTTFDVIPIKSDGRFTTDPIPPGKYMLDLMAYLSTSSNQSPQQSDFEGHTNFTVEATGEMPKVTVHAKPRSASTDRSDSTTQNMLRVVDDAGQPVSKFELAAWTADKGNSGWLIGSRGQIEQGEHLWGFNTANAMAITLRADGYASTLAHFSGGELEKLARGEARVVMRRGQQVEIRFRLPEGMTLPNDLRPEVYFSALRDKVECMWQPANRRIYANLGQSLPDFNMLNVKASAPGRFSLRLAPQTEPFYVAINWPGFIRTFERGPFTWADVKDGVLTIDVVKPAAVDVRFDPASSDRGKLPFDGVTTMIMRRIEGTANSSLIVADADDTQNAPLRFADLAPGDYLITVRTKPKPGQKSILDSVRWPVNAGVFTDGREMSLEAGQTKRVEFHYVPLDMQAFRGDHTAVLHILKPNGKPAIGRQITLGYADGHYGLLKVFAGTVPKSGEISIAALTDHCAADLRGTPYAVMADEQQLGRFGFKTAKSSEDVTFYVPPDAGDMVPDVELWNVSNGKKTKLSGLRGKVVCLEFWASWCGPCREPMEKLNRLVADNRRAWNDKVAIVPISIDDSLDSVRECVMQRGLNQLEHYWAGVGPGPPFSSPVARAFVVDAVPTALIIARDGTIVWRGHPSASADGKNLMSRIEAVLRQ